MTSSLPKDKKYLILYFHVHQPFRLNNYYSPYDVDSNFEYFGGPVGKDNKTVLDRVADRCYRPAGELFLDLIENKDLKIAYSFTGTVLEQWQEFHPDLLDLYKRIHDTGKMDLVSETYYHSLAAFYDPAEFVRQVSKQRDNLEKIFGGKPEVFRNTELTYRNDIGEIIRRLGFKAIFAEGWDPVLDWRSPNFMYRNLPVELDQSTEASLKIVEQELSENGSANDLKAQTELKLLLKNYKRADDIAFRFQLKGWDGYPVTADKFAEWVAAEPGYLTTLAMDYETVGEHHRVESGIFEFYKYLPDALAKYNIEFILPSEAAEMFPAEEAIDYPRIVSWADAERDLSAWTGNEMQQKSLEAIYKAGAELQSALAKLLPSDPRHQKLLHTWGKLQTSDHYYYMSTKYWSDGDVHKLFSPYETPFEGYRNFLNVLGDFRLRLQEIS